LKQAALDEALAALAATFDRTYEGLKQRGGHDACSLLLQLLTVPMRV